MGVSGIQSTGVPDECVEQAVSADNGTDLYRTAVKHVLTVASDRLQKTAEEINIFLSESRCLKMDETPIRFNAKRQYVWACIGDVRQSRQYLEPRFVQKFHLVLCQQHEDLTVLVYENYSEFAT